MKKLALAVFVALALPVGAVASATTLHLTEKQTFEHYVDKGAKGDSPGDIRTFGGTVFQRGKKVGHDRIRCVIAGKCDAQVWLEGGSLISKGFVSNGPRFVAKITAGTGKYVGARGTVTVASGAVSHYTVRLAG